MSPPGLKDVLKGRMFVHSRESPKQEERIEGILYVSPSILICIIYEKNTIQLLPTHR